MRAHWSSVSSWNRDTIPGFQNPAGKFIRHALAALRDAQMFKTAYAFGLRRAELRGLDLADLHFNAKLPQWGQYAALHIRWGKAASGSVPKRRTVFLVPELAWWIDGMTQWVEEARGLFEPGNLSAMWPTERHTRVSLPYIDRRFAALRNELASGFHD